jgi:two-component system, NtrC family, sensor kinase
MKVSHIIGTTVLALAGLGGAGYLYHQAQQIDNTRLERAVSLVQTLQGLDSRWSVELLKVSSNPQAHFDGLAAISPEVRRTSRELKNIARRDKAVTSALRSSILGYVSRLDGKSERVERFKSAYAIVRNSERYLPVAAQLVSARTGEFKQAVLDKSVRSYHTDLKNYFISPSEIEKQRILLNLTDLGSGRERYPPTLRSALGNFLAHALVLMEQKGPLNELRTSATTLAATNVASTLIDDIRGVITARSVTRTNTERMALGVAFATVLGCVIAMTLMMRSGTPRVAPERSDASLKPGPDSGAYEDLDATLFVGERSAAPVTPTPPAIAAITPPAAAVQQDALEQIRSEFLLQLVRGTARRLGSHVGLMKEVYAEVSRGVAESQANLVVGDTRTANSAIIETKATLGELGDLLDLNSVPKLIDATTRTVATVERASVDFYASLTSLVETEREAFDVVAAIERALSNEGDVSGIAYSKSLTEVEAVNGSSDEMTAAFRAIVENAREELAKKDGERVIKVQSAEELGAISVTFTDNGGGMESHVRQSCTEPFFTTKQQHQGLGLSAAEYVVRKHGGRLSINSMADRGTVVRVLLPAQGEELPPE